MQIAYVGFIQNGNIRSYRFEGISPSRPGVPAKHVPFSIAADMAIVSRLRVKFQDVPALCLRTLSAAVGQREENDRTPGLYALTEADVHAYCASILANPAVADHRRRFKPKLKPDSQPQVAARS